MKTSIKDFVDSAIPEIVRALAIPASAAPLSYEIELSKSPEHGDICINLAFRLAGPAKRSPRMVAEVIKKALDKERNSGLAVGLIDRIELAGPGFINFFLKRGAGNEILNAIRKENESYGKSEAGGGKKVLIEFVSANPTGPLTIAHGRQAIVGDTLARLLEMSGYRVTREYYLNDAGRQIRLLGASVLSRYAEIVGQTYPFPEEGYKGAYVAELAENLQKKEGAKVPLTEKGEAKAGAFAVESIMEGILEDLNMLHVTFDNYFSEKSLYKEKIAEAFKILAGRSALYQKDGARWFKSTDYGDDKDRVVQKSTGEFTYLAPDMAYHRDKFARGNELLINLVGPDHHGYVARLRGACQALGHNPECVKVLIVQLVTLYRGGAPFRMSTRAGEFVTLRELMEEVGVDAARVFFIQRKIDTHLDFDVELAKKQSDDNPVFYLQYAHARISSILAFAGRPIPKQADLTLLKELETMALVKKLSEFPEQIADAARLLEPYRVFDYLRELAQVFHKFYTLHRVVTDDLALTDARLILVDAARIVFRNGLNILGVRAPEKM
ncbi:MAG: arginine--tRNA ligase [Candidatus Omnitrophica bacterium]|nr:arginine--tRNA ligase [Candidatus Omnitrophota bacterium]